MAVERSQRLVKRERALVGLWLVMALLLWNGIYDMTVGEGIKEYLFRSALHDAGRAPNVSIASVLDPYLFDAAWVSTFWACLVMLAGLVTIRSLRSPDLKVGPPGGSAPDGMHEA